MKPISRRAHLALVACVSMAALAPGLALAQAKLKVAGIYTVPFEQQWAGRLHQALKAAEARGEIEYKATENVSNADYERVMRGGGRRPQGGQRLSQGQFPNGLQRQAGCAQFQRV
jgi:ABC-type sugar transport system substrate-binding protein